MYIQTTANIIALLLLSGASNALDIARTQQPRVALGLHKASPDTIIKLPPRSQPIVKPLVAPLPPPYYPVKPARVPRADRIVKQPAARDAAQPNSLDDLLVELGGQLMQDASHDPRNGGAWKSPKDYADHLLNELQHQDQLKAAEVAAERPRRVDSAEQRWRILEAQDRDPEFELIRRKEAAAAAKRNAEPARREGRRRRRDVFFDRIRGA
jgi:hypothetical protein